MDILMKHLKGGTGLFLCLGFMFFAQAASAQFKHKWQAEVAAGVAVPAQEKYMIRDGYPNISMVGNMGLGLNLHGQLMRNFNNWSAVGAGIDLIQFNSLGIPNGEKRQDYFTLSTKALSLHGRLYPMGRNHRIAPFLQASMSYSQVNISHGAYNYRVDSLSRHPGNPDHPMLLQVIFSRPEANQGSQAIGFGGAAGAEMLLSDMVGLTLQAGYHQRKTEQMEVLQEDLIYWNFKAGLFFRMFKTKRFY